jgi:hypothetical protein
MQNSTGPRVFWTKNRFSSLGRAILCLVVLLVLPRALNAQRSGALIGVEINRAEEAQEFSEIKAPKYQTLWIAADANGKLAVLATIPELVVPRRDGFWRVGVTQVCEFSPSDGGGGNEKIRQVVWSAPVNQAGSVEQGRKCLPDAPPNESEASSASPSENTHEITQCGFTLSDVEFVSPELISVRNYHSQSESCEPRGGRYETTFHVRRFDADKPVGFSQLLGAQTAQAYARVVPRRAKNDTGEDCGEPFSHADEDWRIGRNAGRWAPYLHQSLGYFGCSVDAPIRVRLPSALSGETFVLSDWKAFYAINKELEDGYASPTGDLAIAITKTETRVYELQQSAPGKLLLTLPAHPVVAVQWATGTHVQNWTAQLQKIASQQLPEPGVVVKEDAK